MSGFQRKPLIIDFPADSEFHGLVVYMRRLKFGAMLEISELSDDPERDSESTRELVTRFSAALQSWNLLNDDGEPVGTDIDSILHPVAGADMDVVLVIVERWVNVAGGIPGPLALSSANGARFQVELPTTELSSANLARLSALKSFSEPSNGSGGTP
jgi:hypothetical protein